MASQRVKISTRKMAAVLGAGLILIVLVWHSLFVAGWNQVLVDRGKGKWIRFDAPTFVSAIPEEEIAIDFITEFKLAEVPPNTRIRIRSLRKVQVEINGRKVSGISLPSVPWKTALSVPVSTYLSVGKNIARFSVSNHRGPPAISVESNLESLNSGTHWMAEFPGQVRSRAVSIHAPPKTKLISDAPSVAESFVGALPFLVLFFAFGLLGFFLHRQKRFELTAKRMKWVLFGAWAVMALNNLFKIGLGFGMDASAHYAYIFHILNHGTLPLAPEGWQTFQPPLFYVAEAIMALFFNLFTDRETVATLLRLLPLACGLLQIEIVFRCMNLLFPKNEIKKIVGLIIGGFIPMNFYISQYVGNEPICGFFIALTILLTLKILVNGYGPNPGRTVSYLSLSLACALLSKVSALLLVPSLLGVFLVSAKQAEFSAQQKFKLLGISVSIVFLISGWWFARNIIELGKPFLGGWELPGQEWWQFPGYVSLSSLFSFGQSLVKPIYSTLYGFWDGLYSSTWLDGNLSGIQAMGPPWNYDFLVSLSWLSFPIVMFMAFRGLQLVKKAISTKDHVTLFLLGNMALFVAAVYYLFLKISVYSTIKGTYLLGLIPCIAYLAAQTLDLSPKKTWIQASLTGYLTCWALTVYSAFFVV